VPAKALAGACAHAGGGAAVEERAEARQRGAVRHFAEAAARTHLVIIAMGTTFSTGGRPLAAAAAT
jgi:hypothetical protein